MCVTHSKRHTGKTLKDSCCSIIQNKKTMINKDRMKHKLPYLSRFPLEYWQKLERFWGPLYRAQRRIKSWRTFEIGAYFQQSHFFWAENNSFTLLHSNLQWRVCHWATTQFSIWVSFSTRIWVKIWTYNSRALHPFHCSMPHPFTGGGWTGNRKARPHTSWQVGGPAILSTK